MTLAQRKALAHAEKIEDANLRGRVIMLVLADSKLELTQLANAVWRDNITSVYDWGWTSRAARELMFEVFV